MADAPEDVRDVLSSAALILRVGGWQRAGVASGAAGGALSYRDAVTADWDACRRTFFTAVDTALHQRPWSDLGLPLEEAVDRYFALDEAVLAELHRRGRLAGEHLFEWLEDPARTLSDLLALLERRR